MPALLSVFPKGRIVSPSACPWGSVTFLNASVSSLRILLVEMWLCTGKRSGTVTVGWDQSRIGSLAEGDHEFSQRSMPWRTRIETKWDMEQVLSVNQAFPPGGVNILVDFQKRKDTFYNISTELGVGSQKYCIHRLLIHVISIHWTHSLCQGVVLSIGGSSWVRPAPQPQVKWLALDPVE